MEKYDLVVVGAGPGGYPAAIRAAQLGLSVALIEKEKLGGTCLNWGCIPTKALIFSASMSRDVKESERSGIKTGPVDYASMVQRKNRIVEKLRGGIAQLLKANGVTVMEGNASFKERNRISVKQGKTISVIETANSIIATGSVSAMPGQMPAGKAVLESRSFLEKETLPDSMIVMGGGIIGCEFACMAARLGVNVTIVEILPDILSLLDKDVRTEARRYMEQELKIRIMTGVPLKKISAGRQGVRGSADGKKLEADILLTAVGRRPVTDGLSLRSAGVALNKAGFIETDENCRTSAATIYAVGDVTGGPQLAHYATAQGMMAAERLAGAKDRREGLGPVPSCIFTDPEIGSVGLTEQDAQAQNRDVLVGKFPFAASGKALTTGDVTGFVKWIADPATGQLLGAQAIGRHATELISEAALAVRFELTAEELARTIHCHPTLSEAWMEAAHAVHGRCIHAPPRKRRN